MAFEDYFDYDLDQDPFADDDSGAGYDKGYPTWNNHKKDKYNPKPKTCNYCGESGLFWVDTDQGWKLFKGNEQHRCKSAMPKTKPRAKKG